MKKSKPELVDELHEYHRALKVQVAKLGELVYSANLLPFYAENEHGKGWPAWQNWVNKTWRTYFHIHTLLRRYEKVGKKLVKLERKDYGKTKGTVADEG